MMPSPGPACILLSHLGWSLRVCSSCSTPVGLGAKSQALLQGSPLLRSFPLCSRLFLVGLLASEITSLLVLDHFHNVHCDAEFQRAG